MQRRTDTETGTTGGFHRHLPTGQRPPEPSPHPQTHHVAAACSGSYAVPEDPSFVQSLSRLLSLSPYPPNGPIELAVPDVRPTCPAAARSAVPLSPPFGIRRVTEPAQADRWLSPAPTSTAPYLSASQTERAGCYPTGLDEPSAGCRADLDRGQSKPTATCRAKPRSASAEMLAATNSTGSSCRTGPNESSGITSAVHGSYR